jgi:hypothetical protein
MMWQAVRMSPYLLGLLAGGSPIPGFNGGLTGYWFLAGSKHSSTSHHNLSRSLSDTRPLFGST